MLTAEMARSLAAMFVETLEREAATTKRVLAAVPEDKLDFKLGDKGKTARELMWHIASSEAWFADAVLSGAFREGEAPAAPATAAEIVAFYDTHIPALLERVKQMSAEQLTKTINFYNVCNLPAVMYLNSLWNCHSVHHRGQLSTYLRAMNARVPAIYGGSADEPFAANAQA